MPSHNDEKSTTLSHADFHAMLLAEPQETLHACAYGAFLDLLEHPQALAWQEHCGWRCAAEEGDLERPSGPLVPLQLLLERFQGRRWRRLQAACLFARYLPLGDGRRLRDLFPDDRCAQALLLGELHAYGLADDHQTGASFLQEVAAQVQDRWIPGAPVGSRPAACAARHAVLAGNPQGGQDHLLYTLSWALEAVADAAAHQPQSGTVEGAVQAAQAWAARCMTHLLS